MDWRKPLPKGLPAKLNMQGVEVPATRLNISINEEIKEAISNISGSQSYRKWDGALLAG